MHHPTDIPETNQQFVHSLRCYINQCAFKNAIYTDTLGQRLLKLTQTTEAKFAILINNICVVSLNNQIKLHFFCGFLLS